jgi:molecular chaperone GrpE
MAEQDVARPPDDVADPGPQRRQEKEPEAGGARSDAEWQAQVEEMADRWRRTAADLENYRKRVSRDAAQAREDERARVAAQWLPVLDNLELALAHAGSESGSVIDGIRAVREQAVAVLAGLGFPRRDDVGRPFDPSHHEAVATVADPAAPPGTVVHVTRPGYGPDDRLLRPASVVVATEP